MSAGSGRSRDAVKIREPKWTGLDALKAQAALLIINSHLEALHLRPWMSADGMLGNTIFFFVSGITLGLSLRHNPGQSLAAFMWKRLSRLYPGVWIVLLLVPPMVAEYSVKTLLYPTQFTFVRTIVPMYPVFFFLLKSDFVAKRLGWLAVVSLVIAFLLLCRNAMQLAGAGIAWSALGDGPWMLHFAGAMLAGGWVALNREQFFGRMVGPQTAWLCLAAVVVYLGLRVMALPFMSARLGTTLQSLTVFALPMAVVVAASLLALTEHASFRAVFSYGPLSVAVTFLAIHSWETYLLHTNIAHWSFVSSLPYPFALVAVFALTFALAPLLRLITNPSSLRKVFSP